MNSIKKVFSMFLCLVFCMAFTTLSVEASGNRDGEIVDGTLLTSNTSAMGIWEAKARGTYLLTGNCSIYGSNGNLTMYGDTICTRICDTVEVNLFLERLVGNTWQPATQRYAISYNTSSVSYSTNIAVVRGTYYRIRAVHIAVKGSVRETNTSYSDSLYMS